MAHLYDLFAEFRNEPFFYEICKDADEVLDIAAGTGRVALYLAERGMKVHCVEPSPAMRDVLAAKLRKKPELGEKVTVSSGTAESFDLGKTFRVILLPAAFDHFMDDEERLASLRNIARHLEPGGRFVFEIYLAYGDYDPHEGARVTVGDTEYVRSNEVEVEGDAVTFTMTFEIKRPGEPVETIVQTSIGAISTREHVLELLDEAGFEVVAELSDYDFAKSFNDGDPMLVIVATK